MSLDHAILGFLSYRPMSGYDLKKHFDESVRHFWPATQSQIYRTLKRMAAAGWVSVEVVEQDDLPDRKVYHLGAAGLAELRRWLATPQEHGGGRSAWLIQVFFAHHLTNAELLALFEQRAEQYRAALAHLGADVPAHVAQRFAEFGSERLRWLWQLTLDNGLAHVACELDWLQAAMARLRELPDGDLPTN